MWINTVTVSNSRKKVKKEVEALQDKINDWITYKFLCFLSAAAAEGSYSTAKYFEVFKLPQSKVICLLVEMRFSK